MRAQKGVRAIHALVKRSGVGPCHVLAEFSAIASSRQVESRTCDGLGYPLEGISKESVEGGAWFHLAAYSKIRDDKSH